MELISTVPSRFPFLTKLTATLEVLTYLGFNLEDLQGIKTHILQSEIWHNL